MWARLKRRLAGPPRHPFDVSLGIDTQGTVSPRRLAARRGPLDQQNVGYVGSQPSVVRKALEAIPRDARPGAFIDLGCGKGRAMAVAGSMFNRVVGIELSPGLVKQARRNMARIVGSTAHYEVIGGDATAPELSGYDDATLFLYNPFGESLVEKLAGHIAESLAGRPALKLWLVYYNPVHAHVFDQRPDLFERYFADRIDFSPEERAAHPFSNAADSIVIWQSRTGTMLPPLPGHDRPVTITIPGLGAEVQ